MQKYLDFFGIKRDMIGINEAFSKTEMLEVYPNPAIDKVCLTFTMNESGAVKISIVDLNGNTVVLLHDNYRIMNSRFSFEWDLCYSFGNKVAPGLYICRVIGQNEVITGKILVH
jgi:predicted RNA-binding protein associated with RNAse of E/G family